MTVSAPDASPSLGIAFTAAQRAEFATWSAIMRRRGLRCEVDLDCESIRELLCIRFRRIADRDGWHVQRLPDGRVQVVDAWCARGIVTTTFDTLAEGLTAVMSALDEEDAEDEGQDRLGAD